MNLLLLEDEALAAGQLQRMIRQYDPTFEVRATLDSVEEAVYWLQTQPPPDLLLADIELTDGQSFDIFERVAVTCPVIFTTAYDEYALRAFRVNSVDYLLKPIDEAALGRSLSKFRDLKKLYGAPSPTVDLRELVALLRQPTGDAEGREMPFRERFLLKQGARLLPVTVQEIAYFFTKERLTFVRTWDGRALTLDYTLDELAETLHPRQFFRANRQVVLSAKAVNRIHLHFNGRLKLDLNPAHEEEVFISRDKAGEFRNWMGE